MSDDLIYLPTLLAGPDGVLPPGHYPAALLRRYGYVVETAVQATPETAVSPAQHPRPRRREALPVTAVPGIGAAKAEALADLGIETVPQLLAAGVETLTQIDGVGAQTAKRWIAEAQKLV